MPSKTDRTRLTENEQKWTKPLWAAGWTAFPSVLLERQQAIGLDPLDLNILLQLARYWFFAGNVPFPSKKALAECIGVDVSTIRKRISKMEAHGLIRRQQRYGAKGGGQQSNRYHFDGLIKAATPFAEELIEERKQRKAEDAARRTRRGPKKPIGKRR